VPSMLLNQTAVYGLRALAVLGAIGPGESLNAERLAERTRVPRQYLSKVMRKLVLARLVLSQRGHGGGFRLRRPLAQIPVRDALAALDLDLGTQCAFGFAACDPLQPCALHPLWSRMHDSLERWTLGSVAGDPPPETVRPCVAAVRA
jgi:Rrf2 family transcriptional regulator, nitric oxide-sensitive transcriptional repressor